MIRLDSDRMADVVGGVTLTMGVGLTAAPSRSAAVLGLGERSTWVRTLGLVDLVMAPGLLRGRPRWPWMAARAALNLVIAENYRRRARRTGGSARASGGAVAMAALTVVDGALAVVLRNSRR